MSNGTLQQYIEQDEVLSKKSKQLKDNHEKSLKALSNQRQNAISEASITNAKLQKYIPQIMRNQGLGGNVGLTEDSMIKLNHEYNNKINNIESNYSAAKSAYDTSYNNALTELYSEADAKRSNSQLENYNIMLENIASWKGSSEELKNYLKANQDKVNQSQFNNLEVQFNNNASAIDEAYDINKNISIGESRRVEGLKSTDEGKNFDVYLGDTKYKVQVGTQYDGTDKDIILNKAKFAGVGDEEIFYCNGNVYLKCGDKIYNVEERDTTSRKYKTELIEYLKIGE